MKFRSDFVTNSSSSSFICEICGDMESGMDMSLSDAGMIRCVNGHEFCESHKIDCKETFETQRDNAISIVKESYNSNKKYSESGNSWAIQRVTKAENYLKLLENISEDDFDDLYSDLQEDYEEAFECVSLDECPICQLQSIVDSEMIEYLIKKNNTTTKKIIKEINSEFGTYDKFKEFLK